MLTIRLTRIGRKNDPSFRVIVVESKRKPQPGNYLEMVGSYDPRTDRVDLKADRIKHWISNGATVSDTVHNLLVSQKIIDGKKINILPAFKAPVVEAAPEVPAVETPITEETEAKASSDDARPSPEEEATRDNSVAVEEPTA